MTKFRLGDWEIFQITHTFKVQLNGNDVATFETYEDALDYVLFREWQDRENKEVTK